MPKLLDELKTAIDQSNVSRRSIAQESGVAESVICRLMSGERGVSIESYEKLADCLGLELTVKPKRHQKGR